MAVDTWRGDAHTGDLSSEVYDQLKAHHDPLYGSFSRLVRSTFDEALSLVPDQSVDLLHIDGLHTYEAVKHDFVTWLPKVSQDGIILMHDIAVTDWGFGVHKVWDEVKEQFRHFEFRHGYGLGMLGRAGAYPAAIEFLFSATETELSGARRLFESLGQRLAFQCRCEFLEAELANERGGKAGRLVRTLRNCSYAIRHPLLSLANRRKSSTNS